MSVSPKKFDFILKIFFLPQRVSYFLWIFISEPGLFLRFFLIFPTFPGWLSYKMVSYIKKTCMLLIAAYGYFRHVHTPTDWYEPIKEFLIIKLGRHRLHFLGLLWAVKNWELSVSIEATEWEVDTKKTLPTFRNIV